MTDRDGGMGEKRRRYNEKYEGTVRAFPLLQAAPAALLPLPLDHFSLSLIFPTTANHLCCNSPSAACPVRPPPSLPFFIHTNDSVKPVKCYEISPAAQPA